MDFGNKLQNLRKDKKLSQEGLAEKLNVSRQAVSKWESNQSYPEMEKLIEMTKIFECTLDDLTNTEKTSETIKRDKVKTPLNDFIDDVTGIVNKSINMFTDMKGEEIFKLIFVMILVAIGIGLIRIPIDKIYHMAADIFSHFGNTASGVLSSILYLVLNIVYIVGGFLLVFYVYKVVYLDKYDESKTPKKDNDLEKSIPEEKETPKEKVKEVVKYNPPKDTTKEWTVLKVLGSIFMFFIKFITVLVSIPFIACFIAFIIFTVVLIWLVVKGVSVIGLTLIIMSFVGLTGILLELFGDLIFSKKVKTKHIFINFIVGLVFLGAGVGLTAIETIDFEYVNQLPSRYTETIYTKEIPFNNKLKLDYYSNTSYIEDETKKDIIKIDVNYYEDISKPRVEVFNDYIQLYYTVEKFDFDIFGDIVKDLKQKKIYNYNELFDYYDYEIIVTTSKENIDILKNNYQKELEEEITIQDTITDMENESNKLRQDNYNLQLQNNETKESLRICEENLDSYKQRIKDLVEE